MDSALLREREAFKKRALALPVVEKRKTTGPDLSKASKKPKVISKPVKSAPGSTANFDYKTNVGSSQYRFGILAKIVRYMKTRRYEGHTHPLTLEEILDETNQLDVGLKNRHWLANEALQNNPKIEVIDGDMFKFRPKYKIKDRKGLLRLLDRQDQQGLGGILYEDAEEALPNVQKTIKTLGDSVILVTRPIDKKQVLFFNDKSTNFDVDEELRKLWRSVAVDGVDEGKIEEYLDKQGISAMMDTGNKVPIPQMKKRKGGNRKKVFKSHNEHMGDIMKDYSDVKK